MSYSSTMHMGIESSSETSVDFQLITRLISQTIRLFREIGARFPAGTDDVSFFIESRADLRPTLLVLSFITFIFLLHFTFLLFYDLVRLPSSSDSSFSPPSPLLSALKVVVFRASCFYWSPLSPSINPSFLVSIPLVYPEDGDSRAGTYLPNCKAPHPPKQQSQ